MKREYFGMLFIILFVVLLFLGDYFLGEEKVKTILSSYIVFFVLFGFYLGQYSMRFPKAF